jgi:mycoredoxin
MTKPVEIIFYGTAWCPGSRRARSAIEARGLPYRYVDIDKDAEGRAYVMQVNHGNRSVPTIVFPDGEILVEPSSSKLNAKLDTMG